MNKKLLIFTIFFAFLIFGTAFAASLSISNPLGNLTFDQLVNRLIGWVRNIALVLVPILIIWGAMMMITAAGDPAKISRGKMTIMYSLIGLAVVLVAESLIDLLQDIVSP